MISGGAQGRGDEVGKEHLDICIECGAKWPTGASGQAHSLCAKHHGKTRSRTTGV